MDGKEPLWFRFFCLQEGKERKQDAVALAHPKEMNSTQSKLHRNLLNLNIKKRNPLTSSGSLDCYYFHS